jgi:hypothetical protein
MKNRIFLREKKRPGFRQTSTIPALEQAKAIIVLPMLPGRKYGRSGWQKTQIRPEVLEILVMSTPHEIVPRIV